VLLGTACAGEAPPVLRVGTRNAGLAPGNVPLVDERAPHVATALGAGGLDVLCVQELWRMEDWAALTAAAAGTLPASVRQPPMPVMAGCETGELDPLVACAGRECAGLAGGPLADCALSRCGGEVGGLSGGCVGCVVEEVGHGSGVPAIVAACEGSGGDGYLYGAAFDTGILTAAEVLESSSRVLDSYLVRAGVDHALIATGAGPLHVFCTHLASNIPEVTYAGEHGSWEGEQSRQIDQLLSFIDETVAAGEPVLLLGDLNTGPEIGPAGIMARWPDHYGRLIAAGFTNPYAARRDVACTACPENTLRADDAMPRLIDHVLVRDLSLRVRCDRFLDEEVEIGGVPSPTHLSDHFGVACDLR
jgi:endonuclease/exonuclease/phosphatase family metal-dependent hydrolase